MGSAARQNPSRRARNALCAVLPRAAVVHEQSDDDGVLIVNGTPLRVQWVGEGWLGDIRTMLAQAGGRPDVAVARRMSPGAREALAAEGIGWVDETGAGEIVAGPIVVSRTGLPEQPRPRGWTPAILGVAEALLCGTEATVSATHRATGLSTGSCVKALRFLTDAGHLTADAERGRGSGRRIVDHDQLLKGYVAAATELADPLHLAVGVTWRDPLVGLAEIGERWDAAGIEWASTGAVASMVLAPYLTSVTSAEVYVGVDHIAGLEAVATEAGLRPIEGGRLVLRPFPTKTTRRLSTVQNGVCVAPWPRVFADLRGLGVRGEDAAEHLREVMHGG